MCVTHRTLSTVTCSNDEDLLYRPTADDSSNIRVRGCSLYTKSSTFCLFGDELNSFQAQLKSNLIEFRSCRRSFVNLLSIAGLEVSDLMDLKDTMLLFELGSFWS
ncbi:hypothetical protein Trydic_g9209 [Trypoxylus dichotomus]